MKTFAFLFSVSLTGAAWLHAQPLPPVPPVPPAMPFFAAALSGPSFLGVGVAEVTDDRAHALNLKEEYGVEVTRVDDESPAAKAGLKAGDVVLEYNGQRVEGIEQFQRFVRETPAGRTVKLLISRGGATQTLTPTIGARKTHAMLAPESIQLPAIEIPDIPNVFTSTRSAVLGVEAESLGQQLAAYFGVKEGVLVRSVVQGSAAEKAGIKAGDVITKVDQMQVSSPGEVSVAIRAARAAKTFPIEIMRDHHQMTITVTIDMDRDRTPTPHARAVKNPA